MAQKLVIGLLVLTLIGAGAIGIYDATRPQPTEETLSESAPAAVAETTTTQVDAAAAQPDPTTDDPPAVVEITPQPAPANPDAPGPVVEAQQANTPVAAAVQQQSSLDNVGEAWTATGVITAFDATGFNFQQADGSTVYIELGPTDFWQNQGVTLVLQDAVTVEGFANGEQYHARVVTVNATGAQLTVRTAEGQPLWSGGASGGGNGNGNAAGTGEVQVAAEDWITIQGVIMTLEANGITMLAEDGAVLALYLGQPTFWQEQGITFAVGDELAVLGFWQNDIFQAGEVTKLATGERLMLRDPNGRPLWSGPGRNGNSGGGSGGNGNATSGGAGNGGGGNGGGGNASSGSAGAGNGGGNANNATVNATNNGGGGNGYQYRGGRTE